MACRLAHSFAIVALQGPLIDSERFGRSASLLRAGNPHIAERRTRQHRTPANRLNFKPAPASAPEPQTVSRCTNRSRPALRHRHQVIITRREPHPHCGVREPTLRHDARSAANLIRALGDGVCQWKCAGRSRPNSPIMPLFDGNGNYLQGILETIQMRLLPNASPR
jgi:hypothetical protein